VSISTLAILRRKATVLTQSILVSTVIAALAASSASASDNGLASLGSNSVATVASATSLRNGDVVDGLLPFTAPMHIEVALKVRNRAALDTFVAAATHPNRLLTQPNVMSSEEFVAKHAPAEDKIQQVVDFLASSGFKNIVVAPNRLLVSADGSADIAQTAFSTSFARVRTADGRDAFANTDAVHIPAALQDTVLAVLGLQTVHQAHTMMKVLPGPQPLSVTGHFPTEFSAIYGGTGVATAAGVTVGIITQGKITQTITDLNTFTSNNGLATVTTQTINTNGTSTDVSGLGEWSLDSQDIVGMAGGQVGKIIFYNIPTLSNANLTADFNTVVSANVAKIINVSLGECETSAQSDGSAAADDQLFAQGVAQGQTFSVSTGDSGADECANGGTTPSSPANSQYVIAAAGTTLNASTSTWSSETVWSGSGGSQSTYEPKPSWQTLWSGPRRGVADIAFDADPNSGSKVIVSGATQQIGGTSLSAPIFAGMWARVIAVKGTAVGFAGPLIYNLPASDFHDVTSGNNGGSTAGVGYDLASGRGSIILNTAINHIGGTATPDFTLSDAPGSASVTQGGSATSTISVTDSGGFTGSVALSASGLPSGVTASFSPASTTSASTLTLTASASATTGPATITITGTSGSLSHTTSLALTVNAASGGGNVLTNNVAVTGLSGATGVLSADYTFTVPAGATAATVAISGGTGDADMYVQVGAAPTLTSYSCRPYVTGNAESCTLTAGNTYHIKINAYAAYTGVSLVGKYTAGGGGGGNVLSNNVAVTGLSGATGVLSADYTFTVPAGATAATVAISGGTGDADMYVQVGVAPTLTSYSCRPYVTGNAESCTLTAGNTYHIKINAYAAYSGVSLLGKYTP